MKFLYLSFDRGIPYWGSKGASIHIREFTKALRQRGHHVDVGIAKLGQIPRETRHVWELPNVMTSFFSTANRGENAKLLAESQSFARNFVPWTPPSENFDIVYERYSLYGLAGMNIARRYGVPFVLEVNAPLVEEERTHRSLVMEPLARAVESYLFSEADLILAVSEQLRDYILSVSRESNVMVLQNGVDARPFVEAESCGRAEDSSEKEGFRVGFVGSLKPWHGLEFLLDSFAELAGGCGIYLSIIGDGPLRESLEVKARDLKISERVEFSGAIGYEHVPAAMKGLDVAVAPYPQMDSFYFSPIKIFEYMAAGLPIVASNIGQIPDILRHDETALLVPPGDTRKLTEALLRLKSDDSLRARLGRNAQQEALNSHTWAARVESIEPTFEALLAKSSGRIDFALSSD